MQNIIQALIYFLCFEQIKWKYFFLKDQTLKTLNEKKENFSFQSTDAYWNKFDMFATG